MPPKKSAKPDKAKQAAKQKVVEDKTFGLKNKKKSAKVQQYVKNVQQSVNRDELKKQQERQTAKERKKAEEAAKREMDELFAMAIKQPRVPPGADPKSIVCEFFRHGKCVLASSHPDCSPSSSTSCVVALLRCCVVPLLRCSSSRFFCGCCLCLHLKCSGAHSHSLARSLVQVHKGVQVQVQP
jgi:hypothetical protein